MRAAGKAPTRAGRVGTEQEPGEATRQPPAGTVIGSIGGGCTAG